MTRAMRAAIAGACAAVTLAGLITDPTVAGQATWPAPRAGGHALVYDSSRGLTLLYGDRGRDATTLWAWDGRVWHASDAPGPGLRRHIKMAYDAARERVVLFGGLDDSGRTFMDDTWEWDGARWTRVTDEGPGPRSSYSMIYDPVRQRILLFGGLTGSDVRSDLWAWDGRRWTELPTSAGPSPRGEAGMIHDPATGDVIVTAGTAYERVRDSAGRPGWRLAAEPLRDTWAWNGRTWRKVANDGPARAFTALVNDPLSGAPLRVGGQSAAGFEGDHWRWTNDGWSLVEGAGIPPRHGVASALDTRRRRVVVFGGSGGTTQQSRPLDDLWEWDGRSWTRMGPPPAR